MTRSAIGSENEGFFSSLFLSAIYSCSALRPALCTPTTGTGKNNLAVFLNPGDLRAFERQVIHQALRTKDEAHDRVLDIGIVDLLART